MISPLGLVVCILATLIAVPVFLADQAEGEGNHTVVAVASEAELSADTTIDSSSVLRIDPTDSEMFEAGAQIDVAASRVSASLASDAPDSAAPDSAAPDTAAQREQAIDVLGATLESGAAAVEATVPVDVIDVEPQSDETTTESTTAPATTTPPVTAAPTSAPPTTAPPATAAPTTAPPATAAPTTAPPAPAEASPSQPTAEQWAALRECESSGNYGAVSSNGLYRGAYQFGQSTWDGVARRTGRTDLVGVRPNEASNGDQDAMALALWLARGWGPWPTCGARLS